MNCEPNHSSLYSTDATVRPGECTDFVVSTQRTGLCDATDGASFEILEGDRVRPVHRELNDACSNQDGIETPCSVLNCRADSHNRFSRP